ncbi:hypothetical protein DRH13_00185 [Candidatus Woesebacteria bacterium]|nr:MAG: hypothetical protein DRH13_00185 [Candidatus Woesebacteria bacterium]
MSAITTGSTIICGKNQSNPDIYPIQFGDGKTSGSLENFAVIHKENLRAYEMECGIAKGTLPNGDVTWLGDNRFAVPSEFQQGQPDINTMRFNNPGGPAELCIEVRFQDNSRELDLVSIEESSPGVFEDPRITIGPFGP